MPHRHVVGDLAEEQRVAVGIRPPRAHQVAEVLGESLTAVVKAREDRAVVETIPAERQPGVAVAQVAKLNDQHGDAATAKSL
jgi:hypothetical protein